jgi:23S rRNA (pseudouridine1915-N3)-methyltransferase
MKIIAVGKKSEFDKQINSYLDRLKSPFKTEICLIHQTRSSGEQARAEDTAQIIKNIDDSDFVILLDERGSVVKNSELLNLILYKKLTKKNNDSAETNQKNIVFVIGGAYGVTEEFRNSRANALISLSGLVLPHQIALLILVEQIFRSQCIFNNHPYHHE